MILSRSRFMFRVGWLIFLTVIGFLTANGQDHSPVLINGHEVHPTRILAKVAPRGEVTAHASAFSNTGMQAVKAFDLVPGLILLEPIPSTAAGAQMQSGDPLERAGELLQRIKELKATGLYEYVEPDYVHFTSVTPADTKFVDGTLWGLRNTGQNGGVAGIDIDAVKAWDITKGSTGVIVAVTDTGIRYSHKDIATQMWRNNGEVAGNGIDDDQNGYIDDVFGINAITGSGNPMDLDGHGTHVAGVIGAAANDGNPMVGVAWNVRLMALKFLDSSGSGDTSAAIECINYAVANGARVINASWGGAPYSSALKDAIKSASDHGVLFVAAAGNEARNTDGVPHYPGGYDLPNIISVAAIDRVGGLAGFSNRGAETVDLGAPGVTVFSTYADSDSSYDTLNGTSMAAPHVSGVAALVLAHRPGINLADLRDRILKTAKATPSLAGTTVTGGRVNAFDALTATGDGVLELSVFPGSGSAVFRKQSTRVEVRVSDLVGLTGATVNGSVSGGGSIIFLDNGLSPDRIAGDGVYSGWLSVPAFGNKVSISVGATAPGKTGAGLVVEYNVFDGPTNDDFVDRLVYEGAGFRLEGSNVGATTETGEPLHAGEIGGASVWWEWTATQNTDVTITTERTSFDTLLAVYTGSSLSSLTEVVSNDDAGPSSTYSRVQFAAAAGTTYLIAIDGWRGEVGSILADVSTGIVPQNDSFDDRIVISGNSVVTAGSLANATLEHGEPMHASYATTGSIWWSWTAPTSGAATISVDANAYASTVVAAYTGTSLNALTAQPGRVGEPQGTNKVRVTIAAAAGTTYHIAVATPGYSVEAEMTLSLSLNEAPSNDMFANRELISGAFVSLSSNNENATREVGESDVFPYAGGSSVWWEWTAPADGTLIVDSAGSDFSVRLSLFSGDAIGNLVELARGETSYRGSGGTTAVLRVSAGSSYLLAADGPYDETGDIVLSVSLLDPPANDNFSDRIRITGVNLSVPGSNVGATAEAGDPNLGSYASGYSVWWEWTAPHAGKATIHTIDPFLPVGVYIGSSLDSLVRVESSNSDPELRGWEFRAEAGVPYQIVVQGYSGFVGDFDLKVLLEQAPANDNFSERIQLSGSSVLVSGTTFNSTREPEEPIHGDSTNVGSVWWSWTAPKDGTLIIEASGADYQPLLFAYAGDSVASLSSVANTQEYASATTKYVFPVNEGTTYHLAMASRSPGAEFQFLLRLVEPPPNDMFGNRIPILGDSQIVHGSNVGATIEPEEAFRSGAPAIATVWWTWVPSISGGAVISTKGSEMFTRIAVYTGNNLSGLSEVVNNETAYGNLGFGRVVVPVEAGTPYQIAVDGYGGVMGELELQVSVRSSPVNDMFAHRQSLAGHVVFATSSTIGSTREAADPRLVPFFPLEGSVWWKWTAPADGAVVLSTEGSDFNTILMVFTGSNLSSLAQIAQSSNDPFGRPTSHVIFDAREGTEYQILVGGVPGSLGEVRLNLWWVRPPKNDDFTDRFLLSGFEDEDGGSLLGATVESGEPGHGANSVWWSWVAPATGTARVQLSSESSRVFLQVYTGDSFDGLMPVENSEGRLPHLRSVFHAIAGTSYQIAVYQQDGLKAGFSLSVALNDAPANDLFANRTTLLGYSSEFGGSVVNATSELNEPDWGLYSSKRTLWWEWTAPADGLARIKIKSRTPLDLRIFSGISLPQLQEEFWAGGDVFTSTFSTIAGETYQLAFNGGHSPAGSFSARLDLVEPPRNDLFEKRLGIFGGNASVLGSNIGASSESGEPGHGAWGVFSSVWWKWTAPQDGRVVLSTAGSDFESSFGVYTGNAVDALSSVSFSSGNMGVPGSSIGSFDAIEGTEYVIAVDGRDGDIGRIVLNLSMPEPPGNDSFENKFGLAGSFLEVQGTNVGAIIDAPDLVYHFGSPPASVWWNWTATVSGRVVIAVSSGEFQPTFLVLEGVDFANLVLIVDGFAPAFSGEPVTARAAFDAVAGTSYAIPVGSLDGSMGTFHLKIETVSPPKNDMFFNRAILTGAQVSVSSSNVGATLEPEEYGHAGVYGPSSVWWGWVAPESGPYEISTAGSAIDTLLEVYTGASLGALNSVVENDNYPDDGTTSRAVFRANAGSEYLIAVSGASGDMGAIQLGLKPASVPVNDLFSNAIEIPPSGGLVFGSNVDATGETGEPYSDPWEATKSVWWKWTAPVSLPVSVTTEGSDFDTMLGVFAGTAINSLGPVAENGNEDYYTQTSRVEFDAIAGTTYHIRVHNERRGSGNISLEVRTPSPGGAAVEKTNNSATIGSPLTLLARTEDYGPVYFQWMLNGVEISGANSASFHIPSLQAFHRSSVSVRIGNAYGSSIATALDIHPDFPETSRGRLKNLSTRALSLTGDNVLIPGFVIHGIGTKRVLIRAVGPTLAEARFGIADALSDPQMVVKKFVSGAYQDIAENDDWGTNGNVDDLIDVSDELYAFELSPGSADAALLLDLDAGQYTVVSSGVDDATGVAIVELYDADGPTSTTKMTSISNRGFVGTGTSVMIPGIVVPNDGPKTLLIRVVGPTLGQDPFNVPGVLDDPVLTVFNGNNAILSNDDWGSDPVMADQTRSVGQSLFAFPLAEGSEDAAFVVTLNPGIYTVVASGANEGSGVALVEVYEVP